MPILIEDSPRNLLTWVERAVLEGVAGGAIFTPFASPLIARSYRRDVGTSIDTIRGLDGRVFFDPTTHALQLPQVGDFRYYSEYDLWPAQPGNLESAADRSDHVRRVFHLQDSFGVPHLAPTVLLHTPTSPASQRALDLSRTAVEQDAACWLSIAGDDHFWGGDTLDAHIGAMAQLEPKGWFLTVARSVGVLPVPAERREVAGLCRTARALSEFADVHISHGDLPGLPAIAAGGRSLGTGWDQRQRMFSYAHYLERDTGSEGGGWYDRPTLEGVLGLLKRPELEVLSGQDADLAARLVPGPIPVGIDGVFMHHVAVLRRTVEELLGRADPRSRYEALAARYNGARAEWPEVERLSGCRLGATEWIEEPAAGLALYGVSEGW